MTAEQAAENIKAKIDELANKAAERMDALADVVSDHNWLDPRIRHRAVEQVVREVLIDFLLGEPR
jgi:prefoldin subunit 5